METQKILEELIAIDSQCSKSNKEIISYIADKLSSFELIPSKFRAYGLDLHNLVVKIPGEQSTNPLVFVGHTDTVVASSDWKTKPFKVNIVDNKLYGLGASDMKAGLACIISSVLSLKQKPKNDIYLLFDADEERGGKGGKKLSKSLSLNNSRVIVAEPSDGQIVYAQKGCLDMELTFTGIAKHSSRADRDYCQKNGAIYRALKFSKSLDNYALEIEKRMDPILGKPTINLGVIRGGTGANTVADKCKLKICRRLISSEDIDDEYQVISNLANKIDPEVKIKTIFYGQPFLADLNSCLIEDLKNISLKNGLDGKLEVKPSWTEAALFSKYGQTVIFGPGQTSVCHQPNEYVDLKDLEIFTKIYQSLMI